MTRPLLTFRPAACGALLSIVSPTGAVLAQVPRDQAQAVRAALQAPPKAAQQGDRPYANSAPLPTSCRKAA